MSLHSVVNSVIILIVTGILFYVLITMNDDFHIFKKNYNTEQDKQHKKLKKTFDSVSKNDTLLDTTNKTHQQRLDDLKTQGDLHATNIDVNKESISNLETSMMKIIDDKYSTINSMIESNDDGNTLIKSGDMGLIQLGQDGQIKFKVSDPNSITVCDTNGENCSRIITQKYVENRLPVKINEVEGFEDGNDEETANFEEGNLKLTRQGKLCGFGGDMTSCKHMVYKQDILSGEYPNLKGPKGDQGEPGINSGDIGDKGDKGDKGDIGPEGPIGPKGDKGDKGDIGETGLTGPSGTPGAPGAVGPSGPAGLVGPAGVTGEKGDTGSKGDAGPKGDIGPAGEGRFQIYVDENFNITNDKSKAKYGGMKVHERIIFGLSGDPPKKYKEKWTHMSNIYRPFGYENPQIKTNVPRKHRFYANYTDDMKGDISTHFNEFKLCMSSWDEWYNKGPDHCTTEYPFTLSRTWGDSSIDKYSWTRDGSSKFLDPYTGDYHSKLYAKTSISGTTGGLRRMVMESWDFYPLN